MNKSNNNSWIHLTKSNQSIENVKKFEKRYFTEKKFKLFYGNYRSLCHLRSQVGLFQFLDIQRLSIV